MESRLFLKLFTLKYLQFMFDKVPFTFPIRDEIPLQNVMY